MSKPVAEASAPSPSKKAKKAKGKKAKHADSQAKQDEKIEEDKSEVAPEVKEVTPKKGKGKKVQEEELGKPDEEEEAAPADQTMEDAGAESDSSDFDPSKLVHETLQKKQRTKSTNSHYTPPDEDAAGKDRRTIFVGNLPTAASEKKGQAALRTHLLSFAKGAKIESFRFRSVAFAAPTAPEVGDEEEKGRREKRERERAKAWRESQEGSTTGTRGNQRGDDEVVDRSKSFIDSKGKRKVAFIKKEFHSEADSCNAYVVFAHPHPDRSANVAPITDPYEAAEAALAANGSEFMDRTIRVDRTRLPSSVALASATNALGKRDAWLPSGTDPKTSLFVGGLDYAAKDQDVRAFFEALVTGERGAPQGHPHWVTDVRIVRDKDTQLGKGFGYVHFIDRESVDELIAMPSSKLKFAKKPIRVQPCKTLPPKKAAAPSTSTDKSGKKVAPKPKRVPPPVMPKGNPKLGEKIKDLPKDERKAVKSADAERLARRLAKKQMKVATAHRETGAVKLGATKAEKGARAAKVKAKKGRVRSSHALSKMKGQRQ